MAKGFLGGVSNYFGVEDAGSTLGREVVGGLTTFATMSYIIFVQPTVLTLAGMDFGSVLLATCLSTALATLLMGFIARYPFACAPGMGQNFLFVFTVVLGMGLSWQAGLGAVLVSGLIFLALSMFGAREKLLNILPECLKNAIGPGIGLFITFVGLQWSGIIVKNPATMVTLVNDQFDYGPPLIVLAGVVVIAALHSRGYGFSILAGILTTSLLGAATGVIPMPKGGVDLSLTTFLRLDVRELALSWDAAIAAVLLLFFLDLFDTVGTLVGVSRQAGFNKEGEPLPRAGRAFFCDAAGTCIGALAGTSTVTTYVESAAGVAAGARTGLASVVTGACFLGVLALTPLLAPVIQIAGQDVGAAFYESAGMDPVSMYPAVAPALIFVGVLMVRPLGAVKWSDLTEALPAFFTIGFMIFGYAITEGIAAGCVSYVVIKVLSGRYREPHPVMYVIAAALVLRYIFLR